MGQKQKAASPKTMVKKCTSCSTSKTPQWREGPEGPKTLCNACGVKFSRDKGTHHKQPRKRALPPVRVKLPIDPSPSESNPPAVEMLDNGSRGGGGAQPLVVSPKLKRGAAKSALPQFNGADFQAASTMLQMGTGELLNNNDPSPAPSTPTGSPQQSLRRSLRVQLRKDRGSNPPSGGSRECAACGGKVNSPTGRHSPSGLMERVFETGLEHVDLSGVPAEEMEKITEAHVQINMLRYELQGAQAVANGAEQVYLSAKKSVENTQAQLKASLSAFRKLTRTIAGGKSSDEPAAKRKRCL
ncbi:hypothetical protein BSKO_13843 [Bryopsis sp. KO-2023]|nr:hypothetical protein BSKO_13843 [Bryopsis sp. KO-2023]